MGDGSLHAGCRVRPVGRRLADGRNGGTLRVHAGLLLLFLGIVSGDSSFSGSAVDRLQRGDSVRDGVRLDLYLPEHSHGALLRTGGFSRVEWDDAGAGGSFLLTGRLPGRETV